MYLSFDMLLNLIKYLIICTSIESFSGNLPSSASTGIFIVLRCTPSICLHTLSCSFSKGSLKFGMHILRYSKLSHPKLRMHIRKIDIGELILPGHQIVSAMCE